VRPKIVLVLAGVAIALGLALLSPLASTKPDPLDHIAEVRSATQVTIGPTPLLPDYEVHSVFVSGPAGKIVAGVVGTLAVFALLMGGGRLLARRRTGAP
jgi:hypothetical protein